MVVVRVEIVFVVCRLTKLCRACTPWLKIARVQSKGRYRNVMIRRETVHVRNVAESVSDSVYSVEQSL